MAIKNIIAELGIRIGADLADLEKQFGEVQSKTQKLGESLSSAGRSLTTAITLPVLGAAAGIGKLAHDFEFSMNSVRAKATEAGTTFDELAVKAKDLGATTSFSASEAADAMTYLAQAGFDTDQIMAAIGPTLNLAAAEGMSLAEAADIASNVITGMGLAAEDSERVMDVLARTSAKSNTNIRQLGEGMKYAAPVASAVGLSVEETSAALGLMSNAGIQATMAGTSLRGALVKLLNPTKEGMDAMAALGITVEDFRDADGNLKPLNEIVKVLEGTSQDAGAMMEIFGQRAGPGMLALVSQGSEALEGLTADLEASGGKAAEMAETKFSGLPGAFAELRSTVEAVGLAFSDAGVGGAIEGFIRSVTGLLRYIKDLDPALLSFIAKTAGLAAAIGPLLLVLGKAVVFLGPGGSMAKGLAIVKGGFTMLTTALGPFGVAIVGIGAAVAGVILYWDEIKAAMEAVGSWISRTFPEVAETAKGLWEEIGATIWTVAAGIEEAVGYVLEWIEEAWSKYGDNILQVVGAIWSQVKNVIGTVLSAVLEVWSIFAAAFRGDWGAVWENVKDLGATIWNGIVQTVRNALDVILGLMPDWAKSWLGIEDAAVPAAESVQAALDANTESMEDAVDQSSDLSSAQEDLARILEDDVVSSAEDARDATKDLTGASEEQEEAIKDLVERLEEYAKKQEEAASRGRAAFLKEQDDVWKAHQDFTDDMIGDLDDFSDDLETQFEDMKPLVVNPMLSARDEIAKGFGSLNDSFSNIFSGEGGLGGILARFKDTITGEGGLKGAFGRVVDSINGEGGLGGAIGSLFGAGSSMSGLISAISGGGGLTDAITGVASLIPGWGQAFAGVSTVLGTLGVDLDDVIGKVGDLLGLGGKSDREKKLFESFGDVFKNLSGPAYQKALQAFENVRGEASRLGVTFEELLQSIGMTVEQVEEAQFAQIVAGAVSQIESSSNAAITAFANWLNGVQGSSASDKLIDAVASAVGVDVAAARDIIAQWQQMGLGSGSSEAPRNPTGEQGVEKPGEGTTGPSLDGESVGSGAAEARRRMMQTLLDGLTQAAEPLAALIAGGDAKALMAGIQDLGRMLSMVAANGRDLGIEGLSQEVAQAMNAASRTGQLAGIDFASAEASAGVLSRELFDVRRLLGADQPIVVQVDVDGERVAEAVVNAAERYGNI